MAIGPIHHPIYLLLVSEIKRPDHEADYLFTSTELRANERVEMLVTCNGYKSSVVFK
jgi:hypothetical protein